MSTNYRYGTALLLFSSLALWVGCEPEPDIDMPGMDAGPFDASAEPDAGMVSPCVEVPLEGELVELSLDIEAELARADVLFLVDTTASMNDEIGQIRDGLRDDIAPGIASAIPDSALGVAVFADFPVMNCGDSSDVPYELVTPITDNLADVQTGVDNIPSSNGIDRPESQVEALYQVATGEGYPPYIPSSGCPDGNGSPCFRADALPVVLLFTDAPFHNGPGGSNPYQCALDRSSGDPHTFEQAVARLNDIGARVIGLYSGDGSGPAEGDLRAVVAQTNALDESGGPLIFDIGLRGERLSSSVVGAIGTLADVIELDVDTVLHDPDPTDGVDPAEFVERVVPVRAQPMDRVGGIDEENGRFLSVRAGTRVFFRLEIRAGSVVPGPDPQRFLLEVIFRGDGRTRLGSRLVEIVVPGEGGEGCEVR